MRAKLILLLTLTTLASGTRVSGQEWARKMFTTTSHDFGSVARGSKAVCRFKFKNLYKETLRVSSVSSSCGCATPTVSSREVKSLETAEIVAEYNTTSFIGEKNATITVTFDDPFYAQVQLRITGYIRSDVVFTPGRINFGRVRHGEPAEEWVEIHYAGHNDWKIEDVRTANDYLEAELFEKSRGDGEVKYRMLLRLVDEAPVGYLKDQLSIVTNDRENARIPLDVEGKVESDVTVNPGSLVFGKLKRGDTASKRIVVRSDKPFKILNVECDDCFEINITDAAKKYHVLPVKFFTDKAKAGKVDTTIRLDTNLGKDAVPEIPVYAQIEE